MTAASDLSCMRRPHSTTRIESAFRMEAKASFRRAELTIFRQDQAAIPDGVPDSELYKFIAYRRIVGPRAHGCNPIRSANTQCSSRARDHPESTTALA